MTVRQPLPRPAVLCLTVTGMLAKSPSLQEERKGPRADAPDQAIEGFLRATGLTRDQLELRDEKKGQVYFAVIDKAGRAWRRRGGRGSGSHDPQFPLAEIHALGHGRPALGAPAALDPVHSL